MILKTRSPRLPDAKPPTKLAIRSAKRLGLRDEQRDPVAERTALRYESRERKRELVDYRGVSNAAEHLNHLPEPGCSIHGVVRGNYNFFDLIPATLRLIAPAKLDFLAVTTLGFSRRVAKRLLILIDSGQVRTADFLIADFFLKVDGEVCAAFRENLRSRGSRLAAAESHAKVLLMLTSDGRHYVSESSANIRSCRALEQFALTQDRELFEFHKTWITELMKNGTQETT
ncbi:MAG: hypothetical protein NTY19_24045 [Planctomycetota bacterium]|nr:hypothetical protein [Planctomycetota bacterium]